jgi:aspartyl-tRNA(Asn)/glutamyl-tRNA(Gln) amidotransferase subunit C
MAIIDKNSIKTLTNLSRIRCSEEEEEALLKDLQAIVAYIEQLSEISTEDVPPCNHVLPGMCNVTREDVALESPAKELILENAPSKIGGLFRVPPVIKQS